MTRAAHRMRSDDPTAARELILRIYTRHAFDFKIFNAGIMVLNLARMRADDFCRHYLPYVERFGFNDQAVLNAYAGDDRVPLDAAWNTYPKFELIENAKILHWLGPMKPWNAMYVQGRDEWRQAEAQFAERAATANAAGGSFGSVPRLCGAFPACFHPVRSKLRLDRRTGAGSRCGHLDHGA